MATHSALTGAELHEPKGVETANANEVYVANGDGASGTWTSTANAYKHILNVHHDDLSTAESHWVVSPVAGTISKIYTVLEEAIATADVVLSFEIGGTVITNSGITIAFTGSAGGDIDSSTPTALNTVTAGQAIEIISDGGTSTSGAHAHVSIVVDTV